MAVEVRRTAVGLQLDLTGEWGMREVEADRAQLAAIDLGAVREVKVSTRGVDALSRALADYAAKVRAAIETADRLGDADSADLFTGISREADKYLWFLEAHLHAKR